MRRHGRKVDDLPCSFQTDKTRAKLLGRDISPLEIHSEYLDRPIFKLLFEADIESGYTY